MKLISISAWPGRAWGLHHLLLASAALVATHGAPALGEEKGCTAAIARVVSLQGQLELLRARSDEWQRVTRLDTPLCQGDRIRTGANSRAALYVQPETVTRIDANTTVSLAQSTEGTQIEFFDQDSAPGVGRGPSCGKLYVITRFPKKFKVKSDYVTAVVDGTEFQLALQRDSTQLAVFEGQVLAEFLAGEPVKVHSGETVTAGKDTAEAVKLIVNPIDAVQWALYYPPILEARAEPASAADCNSLEPALGHACFVERADRSLRVGQVDRAQEDAQQAITLDPTGGEAHALLALIKVVKNDKAGSLEEAKLATSNAPHSLRAWLALSYAQQAHFELEAALKSAQRARSIEPGSALTHARVAELLMSLGRTREAEQEAQLAVTTQPMQSRGHLILGFVHLAQIHTQAAKEDFHRAIELDSSDPLARLGLGLAIIREGHLKEGREELEIAVGLDPTNSLVRSYVGKAYYEENSPERDQLAESQFALAKQYDARDPTPWFYDAILKQSQNRPVEALQDLQKSIELNDNRAVYRSRLLLDEDAASRSVSLARIFNKLGFEQLGAQEAAHSLSLDPSSYAAHRFLSDAYLHTPRNEISRTSELLQAQLLQPVNLNPVQPRMTITEFDLMPAAGPPQTSSDEYAPLFQRDGVKLYTSTVGGNLETLADELILTAVKNKLSLSVGQYYYRTNGFRQNNDVQHNAADIFVQFAVSRELNLQLEGVRRRSQFGDLALNFDPEGFSATTRQAFDQDSVRLGAKVRLCAECDLLVSVASTNRSAQQALAPPGLYVNDEAHATGEQGEIQFIYRLPHFNLVGGIGSYGLNINDLQVLDFTPTYGEPCPLFIPIEVCNSPSDSHQRQNNGYLYANLNPASALSLTLGLGYDEYHAPGLTVIGLNPKFGLQVRPTQAVSVRLSSFKTVKRALPLEQTIEPTQVAGFNQFYDDANGTVSSVTGAGFDIHLTNNVSVGADATQRKIDFPLLLSTGVEIENQRENLLRGYLFWTTSSRWMIRAGIEQSKFSRDSLQLTDDPTNLKTLVIPLGASFLDPYGWTGSVTISDVNQRVERLTTSVLPSGVEHFTVVDGTLGYLLPQRRGTVALKVYNLFDRRFNFQDDLFRTSNQTSITPFCPCRKIQFRLAVNF